MAKPTANKTGASGDAAAVTKDAKKTAAPPAAGKSDKKVKGARKGIRTAYMFYTMENSARLAKDRKEGSKVDLRKVMAREWKKTADKSKWEKMAAADKQRSQAEARS